MTTPGFILTVFAVLTISSILLALHDARMLMLISNSLLNSRLVYPHIHMTSIIEYLIDFSSTTCIKLNSCSCSNLSTKSANWLDDSTNIPVVHSNGLELSFILIFLSHSTCSLSKNSIASIFKIYPSLSSLSFSVVQLSSKFNSSTSQS